jgi:hypothetical protein
MSTSQTASQPARTAPAPGENGGRDRFIEGQLQRTSVLVKLVDLGSSLMMLAAGALAFLLVVAVVDHWIVPLGTVTRWIALLALLAGMACYAAVAILPLILGRVNPVYAARAIEHAEPSLKNSLVNYLLFRSDRAGVRMGVYQALEQRAASDLSHVNTESAVDRSRLIRIGYVLIAVLVVCAGYTILAPKSPFQSAARILAPWADIARPSRVRIENVQPGNAQVFQGQTLTVSAECYNLREAEPVTLFYSTLDGQVAAQQLPLLPADGGLVHRCALPDDVAGFQQDVVYWISAGDATTASYRVQVAPAPSILVERIEYAFPPYTRLPDRVVEDRGDIQAVEGTKVTVYARANLPVAAAVLEFDPATGGDQDRQTGTAAPKNGLSLDPSASRVEMEFRDQQAWCSFYLEMDEARMRPKYQSYHVRFLSEDGHANPQPVLHRLRVIRDLSPEIEILTPAVQRQEVPEDGRQKIEIRALDPDFGIRRITLRAVAGGQDLVDTALVEDEAGLAGQAIVNFDFQPAKLGLRAGDAVTYWAVAADNRRGQPEGSPAPNITKTSEYTLVITPAEHGPPPESPQPEDQPPNAPMPDHAASSEPGSEPSAAGGQGSEPSPGDQTGTGDTGQQQDGQTGSTGETSDGSGSGQDSASGQQSGSGSAGDSGSSSGSSQAGSSSSGSASSADDSGSDGSTGDAGGQTGSGGDGSSDSAGQSGSSSSGSSGSDSVTPGGTGGPEEPLHDGEVFEKAMEYLHQRDDGRAAAASDQPPSPDAGPTDRTSDAADAQPSDGESQDMGDGQESQSPSAAGQQTAGQNAGTGEQPGKPTDQPQGASGEPQPSAGKQADEQKQSPQGQPGGSPQPAESGTQEGSASSGAGQQDQQKKPSGTPSGNTSQSGGGQQPQAKPGQGSPQESSSGGASEKKPDGKKPNGAGGSSPQSGNQPPTPSPSQPQSSAQGEDSSDRSGGGSSGAGQGANKAGTDTAGSNSPSDSGAGAAEESGSGDPSSGGGDAQQAADATGQTGQTPGSGSESRPGAGGSGGVGAEGDSDQNSQTPPVSPATSQGQPDKAGPGVPYGGGVPSTGDLQGFDVTGEVPPGEEPNLQYTRQATNMVLEYLKDQQQNPDQELLDQLGWSPEDMQAFIQRWETMKRSASEDPAARRELDEALRSLGLRRPSGGPRAASAGDGPRGAARNTGARSSPPSSYAEQFNAFRQGTARVTPSTSP